jgi:hypothetical protein
MLAKFACKWLDFCTHTILAALAKEFWGMSKASKEKRR